MHIITHRGLDFSKNNPFAESSYEAFESQLVQGYGSEFDVNFTKDGNIIIFHDAGLSRITKGGNKKLFKEMTLKEVKEVDLAGNKLCDFKELMNLITKYKPEINALHLKGGFQIKEYLDILLDYLKKFTHEVKRLVIFDVKIPTAEYLKSKMPELILAPSVAHPHDVKRFNQYVGGTLITSERAIKNKRLFDWVWLDEWDRKDENGGMKELYTESIFKELRKVGFKIALVSPELHRSSPGLLANEAHEDAKDIDTLKKRQDEIIKLRPDMICTDYPSIIKKKYL